MEIQTHKKYETWDLISTYYFFFNIFIKNKQTKQTQ